MGEPRLRYAELRQRRLSPHLHRRPWKAKPVIIKRRVRISLTHESSERLDAERVYAGHEYFPPQRPLVVRIMLRAAGLASDITLLILLSPFLVSWLLYRRIRTFLRTRADKA